MVKMSNGSLGHLNDSFDKQSIVTEAAKILREDILQYAENINTDHWPPNLALLKDLFESIPATVFDFRQFYVKGFISDRKPDTKCIFPSEIRLSSMY